MLMARQLITFYLTGQTFGLDIMAIREIRAWTSPTRLPQSPDHVAGVVNLRGTVLPVMDLAARLGWEPTAKTERNVIIVAEIAGQLKGLIVDGLSDIVTVQEEDIQPSPPSGGDEGVVPYLEGLIAQEDKMVMIINLLSLADDEPMSDAA